MTFIKGLKVKRRSIEELKEILGEVDDLRANGLILAAACKKVGVSMGSIQAWRRRVAKATDKPIKTAKRGPYKKNGAVATKPTSPLQRIDLHFPPSEENGDDELNDKLVVLIGRTKDVNDSLNTIARIYGR